MSWRIIYDTQARRQIGEIYRYGYTNDGELWYYVPIGSGKGQPIAVKPLPIIAVTTTAGTGSETDNSGVITKEDTFEKAFVGDASLFPVLSIVDPELMASVPPAFTAYQGFDALFHSTEGYIARGANLMSDMYALTAIENLAKYLPRSASCREGRQGHGSPHPRGFRQHPVGRGDVPHAHYQRARP